MTSGLPGDAPESDPVPNRDLVLSASDTDGLESVEQPHLPGTWSATWSGPVPSPSDIAAYNRASSGLGDRLVDHWIAEGVARRALERDMVLGEQRLFSRGQWLGATLALSGMAAAFVLGLAGHDALAGTAFTTVVVGIAAVFVTGRGARKAADE